MGQRFTRTCMATTILALSLSIIQCSAAPAKSAKKACPAKPHAAAPAQAAPAAHAAAPARQAAPNLSGAYKGYLDSLRARVDGKWLLADGKNHVVLAVDVAPDGTVTNLNLTSSPSNTAAEQAASDAFNQSQPLGMLPSGSPPIRLTLTFESTADPHGDNNHSISAKLDVNQPAGTAPAEKHDAAPPEADHN